MSEYDGSFEDHVLETIVESERISVYRMRRIGTRNVLVQLSFSPEGIAIQGDISVRHNGVCSRGKSLEWFAGELPPHYIAEKFLEEGYHEEIARDELSSYIEDFSLDDYEDQGGAVRHVAAARSLLENGALETNSAVNIWAEDEYKYNDDYSLHFGHGYCPDETAWLWAIQRAFARLWNAKHGGAE